MGSSVPLLKKVYTFHLRGIYLLIDMYIPFHREVYTYFYALTGMWSNGKEGSR